MLHAVLLCSSNLIPWYSYTVIITGGKFNTYSCTVPGVYDMYVLGKGAPVIFGWPNAKDDIVYI